MGFYQSPIKMPGTKDFMRRYFHHMRHSYRISNTVRKVLNFVKFENLFENIFTRFSIFQKKNNSNSHFLLSLNKYILEKVFRISRKLEDFKIQNKKVPNGKLLSRLPAYVILFMMAQMHCNFGIFSF